MKFNNHIPYKILALVGAVILAAGLSFGYYLAQFDDLVITPTPDEQYEIPRVNDCVPHVRVLARNTATGEIRHFDSSCEVPINDWQIISYSEEDSSEYGNERNPFLDRSQQSPQ